MRIETAELKAIGATKSQLEAYCGTDPLIITKDEETYTIKDFDGTETGLTAAEVLEYLDGIAAMNEQVDE